LDQNPLLYSRAEVVKHLDDMGSPEYVRNVYISEDYKHIQYYLIKDLVSVHLTLFQPTCKNINAFETRRNKLWTYKYLVNLTFVLSKDWAKC